MKTYKTKQGTAVSLGHLGLMAHFRRIGHRTVYRTIDYAPMNTCPHYGTRWCLNMTTLKAEYFLCREKIIVSESSEVIGS